MTIPTQDMKTMQTVFIARDLSRVQPKIPRRPPLTEPVALAHDQHTGTIRKGLVDICPGIE